MNIPVKNYKRSKNGNKDTRLKQMQTGLLEFAVLLIISKEASYGKEILEKLSETIFAPSEGTLYSLLTKLKTEKLVLHHWEEADSGPPKKYYYLTETGEKTLVEMKKHWENLDETFSKIIS